MENETNVGTINQWIREKQALEMGLALDLLEIFNEPDCGLITGLRTFVYRSVDDMDDRRTASKTAFENKWQGSWRNYACCTDHGIQFWNAEKIKKAASKFTAEQCADWIRIYGEVIEDISRGDDDIKRKEPQRGGKDHWNKDLNDPSAKRLRIKPVNNPNPQPNTPVQDMFRFAGSFSGLANWDIVAGDTCGKMDQVFGLCPGATISGTTTDNIFFFERFGSANVGPLFFLLPTAAIVGGGHHTMLEVALPLSLCNIIDYKVGLYTTLFPDRTGVVASEEIEAGARAISNTLTVYETNPQNHLMLIYYDKVPSIAGCFRYDYTTEKKDWTKFTAANKQLMDFFDGLPPSPGEAKVSNLRNKNFNK